MQIWLADPLLGGNVQNLTMTLSGSEMGSATDVFADVDGVVAVLRAEDDPD